MGTRISGIFGDKFPKFPKWGMLSVGSAQRRCAPTTAKRPGPWTSPISGSFDPIGGAAILATPSGSRGRCVRVMLRGLAGHEQD